VADGAVRRQQGRVLYDQDGDRGGAHERQASNVDTFNWALGTGLKFGNLQIDATLNEAFPHNLPNFISGVTTTDVFPKVTATYPF
jgi:hypothetical protein